MTKLEVSSCTFRKSIILNQSRIIPINSFCQIKLKEVSHFFSVIIKSAAVPLGLTSVTCLENTACLGTFTVKAHLIKKQRTCFTFCYRPHMITAWIQITNERICCRIWMWTWRATVMCWPCHQCHENTAASTSVALWTTPDIARSKERCSSLCTVRNEHWITHTHRKTYIYYMYIHTYGYHNVLYCIFELVWRQTTGDVRGEASCLPLPPVFILSYANHVLTPTLYLMHRDVINRSSRLDLRKKVNNHRSLSLN